MCTIQPGVCKRAIAFGTAFFITLISGCSQSADIQVHSPAPVKSGGGGQGLHLEIISGDYDLIVQQVKPLDVLFVVDSSGSMADNQDSLAKGMDQVADVFFNRRDLDICPITISSDRRIGRSIAGFAQEKYADCTNPPGTESLSDSAFQARINAIKPVFHDNILYGTNGNSTELLGEAALASIFNQNAWSDSKFDSSGLSPHIRAKSQLVLVFLTDENNYDGASPNDLGAFKGSTASGATDDRLGLIDYLDQMEKLRGNTSAHYSVASFLSLSTDSAGKKTLDPVNGAVNLAELVTKLAAGDQIGDVLGAATDYTDTLNTLFKNSVSKFNSFYLGANPEDPTLVQVALIRSGVTFMNLTNGKEFSVNGRTLTVDPTFLDTVALKGDSISVRFKGWVE